jgi:hypothetical protein
MITDFPIVPPFLIGVSSNPTPKRLEGTVILPPLSMRLPRHHDLTMIINQSILIYQKVFGTDTVRLKDGGKYDEEHKGNDLQTTGGQCRGLL